MVTALRIRTRHTYRCAAIDDDIKAGVLADQIWDQIMLLMSLDLSSKDSKKREGPYSARFIKSAGVVWTYSIK
jgi:hypothetical protein